MSVFGLAGILEMTERRFYRQALFLPAIVTAGAWLIIWIDKTTQFFSVNGEGLIGLAIVIGYSGLWAAIPYIVVAAIIWIWLGRLRKESPQGTEAVHPAPYSSVLVWAPIAVIALGNILLLVVGVVKQDFALSGLALFYSVWGIIVGYAYVLIIVALHLVATRAGWVIVDS